MSAKVLDESQCAQMCTVPATVVDKKETEMDPQETWQGTRMKNHQKEVVVELKMTRDPHRCR